MILFQGTGGRLVALTDPVMQGILPLTSIKGDDAISFQEQKSLITSISIAQETNFQFLHTLGGDIYIYVFGDRIGQLTLSGLSAAKVCNDPGSTKHGFELMMKWYQDHKLSARKKPVQVMIGETPILGFVAGMQGGVFDHRLYLMQWTLSLMVLPEKPGPRAIPVNDAAPAVTNNQAIV